MNLEIGKIYRSKKRDHNGRTGAYHPFVFIEECDDGQFRGAMLTTKNNKNYRNYLLEKKYFVSDPDKSKTNYFVPNIFIKKYNWKPFEELGEISSEGVDHILTKADNNDHMSFEEYRNN